MKKTRNSIPSVGNLRLNAAVSKNHARKPRHLVSGFRASMMLFALCFLLITVTPLWAWKITPELQKEQNAKLAAVAENPYSPDAHFELAITYAYTNKIQEGMDELKKVHSLDPDFAPVALDLYSKAAQKNPKDWKTLYRYAFALYFNNKKSEAVDTFKQIIKIDPKNVFAYGYIALILGEQNKTDEGVDWAKKGLAVDSNVAAMHLLLAAGYNRQGKNWESFWEGVEALRLKAAGF